MKYKIIALDLDGTLTNTQKEIPQRNIDALHEAQKHGVKVILASGRPIPGIIPVAAKISLEKFNGYVMAYNGGLILDYQSKETLYQKYLQPERMGTVPHDRHRNICNVVYCPIGKVGI